MICMKPGCGREAKARGRCGTHYDAFRTSPAFSYATGYGGVEPLVCICAEPDPDGIGECRKCRRLRVPE